MTPGKWHLNLDIRVLGAVWLATVLLILLWTPLPDKAEMARVEDPDVEVAREFLRLNAGDFGVPASLADLRLAEVRTFQGGKNIHFQQFYQDVPVFDGGISVTVKTEGRIGFTASGYKANLKVGWPQSFADFREVERRIDALLGTSISHRVSSGMLMAYRDQDSKDHLVWHFVGGGPAIEVTEFLVEVETLRVLLAISVTDYADQPATELRELFPAFYVPMK